MTFQGNVLKEYLKNVYIKQNNIFNGARSTCVAETFCHTTSNLLKGLGYSKQAKMQYILQKGDSFPVLATLRNFLHPLLQL